LIQTEARLGEKVVQAGADESTKPIPAALFAVVDTNAMTIMKRRANVAV